MTIEEIKEALADAWHEIGHAYAHLGKTNCLAALISVTKAREKINLVYKALDKIQD